MHSLSPARPRARRASKPTSLPKTARAIHRDRLGDPTFAPSSPPAPNMPSSVARARRKRSEPAVTRWIASHQLGARMRPVDRSGAARGRRSACADSGSCRAVPDPAGPHRGRQSRDAAVVQPGTATSTAPPRAWILPIVPHRDSRWNRHGTSRASGSSSTSATAIRRRASASKARTTSTSSSAGSSSGWRRGCSRCGASSSRWRGGCGSPIRRKRCASPSRAGLQSSASRARRWKLIRQLSDILASGHGRPRSTRRRLTGAVHLAIL